jgi:hypothetical protein
MVKQYAMVELVGRLGSQPEKRKNGEFYVLDIGVGGSRTKDENGNEVKVPGDWFSCLVPTTPDFLALGLQKGQAVKVVGWLGLGSWTDDRYVAVKGAKNAKGEPLPTHPTFKTPQIRVNEITPIIEVKSAGLKVNEPAMSGSV